MKIDKEYPATHSMDTAWYFVDKEDNVAIFEIQENGPIPHNVEQDHCIEELCFEIPVEEQEFGKKFNFTDEQVLAMVDGLWEEDVPNDLYWSNDEVFQINTDKKAEFFDYLKKCRKKDNYYDNFLPLCLSEKLGIYMADLNSYKYGNGFTNPHAKYLFENGIILRYCRLYFCTDYDEELKEDIVIDEMKSRCPYYLYTNDWDAAPPHRKVSTPCAPMKLNQMPEHLRKKVIRLNFNFKDSEEIQIADETLCYQSGWHKLHTPEGAVYSLVGFPSKKYKFVLDDSMTTDKCKELGIKEEEIYDYIQRFPHYLDERRIDDLLKLEDNKDFVDLRK